MSCSPGAFREAVIRTLLLKRCLSIVLKFYTNGYMRFDAMLQINSIIFELSLLCTIHDSFASLFF